MVSVDVRDAAILLLAAAALTDCGGVPPDPRPAGWGAIGAIQPRIAPDGASVAVSYQGAIWRVPCTGGVMRRLTHGPGFDTEPAWSADGDRIAHVNGWQGRVLVIDAHSGEPCGPASDGRASGRLYFHPDGLRLLGAFDQHGQHRLAWMDLASGAVRQLPLPALYRPVFALSPDGARIAFVTHADVEGEQEGNDGACADVWVAPAEGTGEQRKVARTRSRIHHLEWCGGDLVYSTDTGGAHDDLWWMSLADSSQRRRLTDGPVDEISPSATPDGAWLVYADNRAGTTAVVVRAMATGAEQQIVVAGLDFGAPAGRVRVRVVDAAEGRPVTARVSLRRENGKYHAAPATLYRQDGALVYSYLDDAEFAVPAGRYELRAFRGLEYLETRRDVEVVAGATSDVSVELQRWIAPAQRSWFGGESHIHANYGYGSWYNTPRTVLPQVQGEGLNVANLVIANSDAEGIFDLEFWSGAPDPVSTTRHVLYWNQEIRATLWGHLTLYGLQRRVEPLMTGFPGTPRPHDFPPNADIADSVHEQDGHVNYAHPLVTPDPFQHAYSAKELPVDVALGKVDSLDINWRFEMAVPLWYRLLNCGFRLPASAGTDCFLNRIRARRPGVDRVYVHVDGPFSYTAWVAGLKAGRSFVTDGPWLELEVAGKSLGETIELDGPGEVAVSALATAPQPLQRVELVHNGAVLAAARLAPDAKTGRIEQRIQLNVGGWLSLRAYGGRTQAHTSPVYVRIAGATATSNSDAEYFLDWIDRLETKLRYRDRFATVRQREHVAALLASARAVYTRIARRR